MTVSVIIATYGDHDQWWPLANRAQESVVGAHDVVRLHITDMTISQVRNRAASDATGEYLLYVDADDELAPGYIGAMETAVMDRMVRSDVLAHRTLFTPAVQVVRPGRPPGAPTFFKQVPLRDANWLVVGTLIHRDLFWEVGGFHEAEHGLEDFGLWSKCARVGATVVKVPGAVYRYHANPNSMHRQLWRDKTKQREAHKRVLRELDEWEASR